MECQRKPQFFCFLHGRHNKFFIHQGNAVIGKPGGSGRCQRFHIREFFSLQTLGDGRCLQHMDQGFLAFFLYQIQCLHIINRRFRICHAHDCRKSASCRCRRSGENVLFVGQPRIPEMYMGIHKSRCHHES